ncbi:MAG: zinc ABC transporter substrate-binding protein [Phormidesmis sp. RL_2_1]|nr:zinc ABC transporter substrate-binding protein [Phormidesmis sp. RL_2_1]
MTTKVDTPWPVRRHIRHVGSVLKLALTTSLLVGAVACANGPVAETLSEPVPAPDSAGNPSAASTDEVADNQPLVVTTVAPITNIVSNIAGDRIKVVGLVPEGTNSHTFEPRPSDGELLAQADLILVNGLSLEVPSIAMATSVKAEDTEIYELGTNVITQEQWLFDNSFPAAEGKPNPHLWVNPDYAAAYAKLATEQLTALDPEGKATFEANLASFLAQIEALDRVTRAVVDSIPASNRKLLTYHDSWPYWARKYGFEVIGAVQPSDFSEPSASEVAALVDQIRASKVPAIFGSEVFPSKVSEQIAREANVKLDNTADDDLPGEGSANAIENAELVEQNQASDEHTYIGMMAENLRIFANNLGGDASLVDSLDVTNVVE